MDHALLILIFLIAVALLFDFLNGRHDAAGTRRRHLRQP